MFVHGFITFEILSLGPKIRVSQTFLTLTNFIEKSINMYNIK